MIPVRSSSGAISHSARTVLAGRRPCGPTTERDERRRQRLDVARPRVDRLLGDAVDDRLDHRRRQAGARSRRRTTPACRADRPRRRAAPTRWRRRRGRRRARRPRSARGRRRRRRSPPPRSARARSRPRAARGAARTTSRGVRRRRPARARRRAGRRRHRSGRASRSSRPSPRRAAPRSARRRCGRPRSRRPPPRPAASGSALVSMRAQSHHSGPLVGCRSTIRRQATTSPDGSRPRPRSAPAVSRTERLGVGAPRPGHVAQALDRVHALTVPTASSRPGDVGGRRTRACYRRTPWRPTPRWTSMLAPLGAAAPPARGVADHVPPGDRRPRPVHQRELVDPRRRRRASWRACAAPTPGSTSSSPPTSATPAPSSAR